MVSERWLARHAGVIPPQMSSSRTVQDSGQVGEYTENPRGTLRKKCASELALGWRWGVPRAMGCRGFGGGYMTTLRHTKKEMMEMALVFLGRRF